MPRRHAPAWHVRPAGTYTLGTIGHGIVGWRSDYAGLLATSVTYTIIQRVPGIQLWLIVAWY